MKIASQVSCNFRAFLKTYQKFKNEYTDDGHNARFNHTINSVLHTKCKLHNFTFLFAQFKFCGNATFKLEKEA